MLYSYSWELPPKQINRKNTFSKIKSQNYEKWGCGENLGKIYRHTYNWKINDRHTVVFSNISVNLIAFTSFSASFNFDKTSVKIQQMDEFITSYLTGCPKVALWAVACEGAGLVLTSPHPTGRIKAFVNLHLASLSFIPWATENTINIQRLLTQQSKENNFGGLL